MYKVCNLSDQNTVIKWCSFISAVQFLHFYLFNYYIYIYIYIYIHTHTHVYTHTGKCGIKRKISYYSLFSPIPLLFLSPVVIYIPNRYLYISNKLHSIYIWLLQILLIEKNVHRHFPQMRSFKFKVSCTLLFFPWWQYI